MSTLCDAIDGQGLAVVREVLPEEVVASLRRCFETLEARGVPTSRQVLYTHREPREPRPELGVLMEQWFNPHRRVGDGSTNEPMVTLGRWLAEVTGRRLMAFQDLLLSKRREHRVFPWHQDEPFWPVDCAWGIVAWCALDPTDATNGGVEFALGSHRDGLGPAVDLHTGEAQQGTSGRLADLHRYEFACPALRPGDAVIFHSRTWHRSRENMTGRPRRAWASTWLSPDARWNRDRAPRHPLASLLAPGLTIGESPLFRGIPCDD